MIINETKMATDSCLFTFGLALASVVPDFPSLYTSALHFPIFYRVLEVGRTEWKYHIINIDIFSLINF